MTPPTLLALRDGRTTAMSEPVDISIIIVNWNVRNLLLGCLESVLAGLDASTGSEDQGHGGTRLRGEVWVVDNASTDGSVEAVQQRFPSVHIIANRTNVGFPEGNNQALRRCVGATALLLNPDTVVLPGALAALVRVLQHHPDTGAVGPTLLNPDGTVQSSRRRFPTLRIGLFESTVVQRYAPHAPSLRRYYVLDQPDTEPLEVDWVHGACFLVRRAAWERVGLLDTRIHMYSEEVEWLYRIKLAGWKVRYEPAARVLHYGGQSSAQDVLARHLRFHESKYYYARLHRSRPEALFLRWFILLTYLFQGWEEGLKYLLRQKPALRRARLGMIARIVAWHVGWPA